MPVLLLCALGVGLPAALVFAGVSSVAWVLGGAAAWAAAVALKVAAGAPLGSWLERILPRSGLKAAIWGTWSALCELGLAALAFASFPATKGLGDILGFGVGAGSIEALYILAIALATAGRQSTGAGPVSWSAAVERLIASAGHLASRGLVWTGLQSWLTAPFILLAVLLFAVVDGVATWGSDVGWDWENRRTLRRFFGFVTLVTACEVAALAASLFLLG